MLDKKNLQQEILNNLFLYIAVFTIIVLSGSFFLVVDFPISKIKIVFFVLLLLFFLLKIQTINFKDIPFYYVLYFTMMYLTSYAIFSKDNSIVSYMYFLIIIYMALLISYVISWEQFKKGYVNWMVFLSVISLFLYYFGADFMVKYGIKFHNEVVNRDYYSILVYTFVPAFGRNSGMFWEPGLYSTAIIYAILLINQEKISKLNILKNIIFVLTMLSTKSTAGYVLCIITYYYIFSTHISKSSKHYKLFIGFFIVVSFLMVLLIILKDNIIYALNLQDERLYEKLLNKNLFNNPRVIAVKTNLELFFDNFFTGLGISGSEKSLVSLDSGDTATSFHMLSKFGIWGLGYTIMIIHAVAKAKNINIMSKLILLVLLLLIVNKEPNNVYLLSWCIFFYMLKGASFNNIALEK